MPMDEKENLLEVSGRVRGFGLLSRGEDSRGAVLEVLLPEDAGNIETIIGIHNWRGFVVDCLAGSEYSWVEKAFECVVAALVVPVWTEGELEVSL